MTDVILFGVGAALIVDYEETCRRLGVGIAAAVQNREGESYVSDRTRLIGPDALTPALLRIAFLCPIFSPADRRIAVQEATAAGLRPAEALIDPTSAVATTTRIGPGGYVNAGCQIGAAGEVGAHVVINRGSSVGHHGRIGDFVSIGPGVVVAGKATIGSAAMLGAGAVVLPGIRIGSGAVVGAGAVVTRDVADGATVVGNPARIVGRGGRTRLARGPDQT